MSIRIYVYVHMIALRLKAILLNLLLPKKSRSFLEPDMGTWWRFSFIHMHTRDYFEEKTHLQRNISHIDRPHPSQSKLLPLAFKSSDPNSSIMGFPVFFLAQVRTKNTGFNEPLKKTQSSTKTKNLFRNTIKIIWTTNLSFSRGNLGSWVHTKSGNWEWRSWKK